MYPNEWKGIEMHEQIDTKGEITVQSGDTLSSSFPGVGLMVG